MSFYPQKKKKLYVVFYANSFKNLFTYFFLMNSESRGGFGMFGTLIGVTIQTSSFGKR
jgi:prolipoprotein diacylglyceryltransferase